MHFRPFYVGHFDAAQGEFTPLRAGVKRAKKVDKKPDCHTIELQSIIKITIRIIGLPVNNANIPLNLESFFCS